MCFVDENGKGVGWGDVTHIVPLHSFYAPNSQTMLFIPYIKFTCNQKKGKIGILFSLH